MTCTSTTPPSISQPRIAGIGRRTAGALAAAVVVAWVLGGTPAFARQGDAAPVAAAAAQAGPGAHQAAAAGGPSAAGAPRGGEGEGEPEHGESIWAVIGRLFNFALLAGVLVYLLRSPLMAYLEQRGVHVRGELARARDLRAEAGAEVERVEAEMAALPAEIEALKRRGAEDIAAEEARIRDLAESERRRLLEQARREIETELRVAERELKRRAGELAVGVATDRVRRAITDADQGRLVDRYVAQVRE